VSNPFIANASANANVNRVVETFDTRFPGRVQACYLIGSYADDTAVGLSDIDLIVVFRDCYRDEQEKESAQTLAQELANQLGPIRLDVTPREQAAIDTMYAVIRVGLKHGSKLVFGQDIRDRITLPAHDEYVQDVIAGAMFFISRLHGIERVSSLPLTYPDPTDKYFGYTKKRFADWYPPNITAGTKEFVAAVSRIATATVALNTGKSIGSKSEGIRLYHEIIGGAWGEFAAAVYQRCKKD
jgi:predicted nucleotidyltransferase